MPGVLLGGYPNYVSFPYDTKRVKERKAALVAIEKRRGRAAFKGGITGKICFDSNSMGASEVFSWDGDKPRPSTAATKIKAMPLENRRPWTPSAPAKKGHNRYIYRVIYSSR